MNIIICLNLIVKLCQNYLKVFKFKKHNILSKLFWGHTKTQENYKSELVIILIDSNVCKVISEFWLKFTYGDQILNIIKIRKILRTH